MSDKTTPKYQKNIQRATLLNDTFMTMVFSHFPKVTEFVLRTIMGKPDLIVTEIQSQHEKRSFLNRSVKLDVYAVDSENRLYDIEVQNAEQGAEAKRARYNSSVMDSSYLEKGSKFSELPETYVIFITATDVLSGNKALYHIDRTVKELENKDFGDGAHIIYVNTAYKGESEIAKMLHDFTCADPNEMRCAELANATRYFKDNDKGVKEMDKWMQEIIDKENEEVTLRIAKNLLECKCDISTIVKCTSLSVEKIEELKGSLSPSV